MSNTIKKTAFKMLRKSTNDNDLFNQETIVDQYMETQGLKCIEQFRAIDTPRFEMKQYLEKEVIPKVREMKPDYLVFRDQTRLGLEDVGEVGWFTTLLKEVGAKVVFADDGRVIDWRNDANAMTTFTKQQGSRQEVIDKSYRTQIGRRKAVDSVTSPGKLCSYGYDWMVYNRAGEPRYSLVFEGKVRCEGEHRVKDKTTQEERRKLNFAWQRTKIYPDNRREPYNDEWTWCEKESKWVIIINRPVLEKGDKKCEVINLDRLPHAQEIFQLADQPLWLTPHEIAKELDKKGIRPPAYPACDKWSDNTVRGIIQNPIYKGWPVDNLRQTRLLKFPRKYTDLHYYPLSDEERASIRIVSEEQWDRVNAHLRPRQGKRKKMANLGDYWLKNFAVCGKCGIALYVRGPGKYHSGSYHCLKCGAVKPAIVHELHDVWLDGLINFHKTEEVQRREITGLAVDCATRNTRHISDYTLLQQSMWQYYMDHNPSVTETFLEAQAKVFQQQREEIQICCLVDKVKLAPEYASMCQEQKQQLETLLNQKLDYIANLYQETFAAMHQPTQNEIMLVDTNLDRLYNLWKETDMKGVRTRLSLDIKSLEAQKVALQEKMVSLVPKYQAVLDRLARNRETLKQLSIDVRNATGENRAVLLGKYLDKITLFFDAAGKSRADCKLVRVEVHAKDPTFPVRVFEKEECQHFIDKHNGRLTPAPWTPERRAEHSETMRRIVTGSTWTPERKAKHSKRMKEVWAENKRPPWTAEQKEAQSKRMKEWFESTKKATEDQSSVA